MTPDEARGVLRHFRHTGLTVESGIPGYQTGVNLPKPVVEAMIALLVDDRDRETLASVFTGVDHQIIKFMWT